MGSSKAPPVPSPEAPPPPPLPTAATGVGGKPKPTANLGGTFLTAAMPGAPPLTKPKKTFGGY